MHKTVHCTRSGRNANIGRDTQFQLARSRPQIDVATSLCSSHKNAPVATQNLGRNTRPTEGSQNHVATSNRCRDTTQNTPGRDFKTGSRHRFSCPRQPSWRLTYVATSISCRDLISAHIGISGSRRKIPGRDLPYCYPCRDLKNDVVISN